MTCRRTWDSTRWTLIDKLHPFLACCHSPQLHGSQAAVVKHQQAMQSARAALSLMRESEKYQQQIAAYNNLRAKLSSKAEAQRAQAAEAQMAVVQQQTTLKVAQDAVDELMQQADILAARVHQLAKVRWLLHRQGQISCIQHGTCVALPFLSCARLLSITWHMCVLCGALHRFGL